MRCGGERGGGRERERARERVHSSLLLRSAGFVHSFQQFQGQFDVFQRQSSVCTSLIQSHYTELKSFSVSLTCWGADEREEWLI
jgi:hypothetical protein